ncbi:diaminopimelate decarboxylase [bacterium]|nr:diaminopimelate decarboxylase [bacterium]
MFIPSLEHAKHCYQQFSSPTFLTEEKNLSQRVQQLKAAFSPSTQFYYAIKANYNPFIISLLKKEGIDGIDTVSPFEIKLAKKLGFDHSHIVFTGCASDKHELQTVKDEGVLLNLGSLSELSTYAKLYPNSDISLRINPGMGEGENKKVITAGEDAKFGIAQKDLKQALKLCKESQLKVIGLHMHLGSGLYQSDIFEKALTPMFSLAQSLNDLKFVDLGGGFGVRHQRQQKQIDLDSFAKVLQQKLSEYKLSHLDIRFEPGKFLVAESTALICKVNVVKELAYQQCLILDTGFNHLIRPAFYQSYHEIINLSRPHENCVSTKIEGYLCESGDVFNPDLSFPKSQEGDYLAILSSGGYGSSMSSLYNFRPYAAEAMLTKDNEISVCRQTLNFDQIWSNMGWKE